MVNLQESRRRRYVSVTIEITWNSLLISSKAHSINHLDTLLRISGVFLPSLCISSYSLKSKSELFKSEMLETSFILHREPYINQVSNVYDMKRSICFLKRTPNISRCNSSCVISYIENKILVFTLTMNKKYMSKRVSSKTSFEYTESNPQCVSIYTNMQTLKRT